MLKIRADGNTITILVDGKVVWTGTLGEWSRALALR